MTPEEVRHAIQMAGYSNEEVADIIQAAEIVCSTTTFSLRDSVYAILLAMGECRVDTKNISQRLKEFNEQFNKKR